MNIIRNPSRLVIFFRYSGLWHGYDYNNYYDILRIVKLRFCFSAIQTFNVNKTGKKICGRVKSYAFLSPVKASKD